MSATATFGDGSGSRQRAGMSGDGGGGGGFPHAATVAKATGRIPAGMRFSAEVL